MTKSEYFDFKKEDDIEKALKKKQNYFITWYASGVCIIDRIEKTDYKDRIY